MKLSLAVAVSALVSSFALASEIPSVGPEAVVPIQGMPLGADEIDEWLTRYRDFDSRVELTSKDQVVGVFKACDVGVIGETPRCDELRFVFAEVRVDRQEGKLLIGGEIAGKVGNGWLTGPRLTDGWKLSHRVSVLPSAPRSVIGGRGRVELFIEKAR